MLVQLRANTYRVPLHEVWLSFVTPFIAEMQAVLAYPLFPPAFHDCVMARLIWYGI